MKITKPMTTGKIIFLSLALIFAIGIIISLSLFSESSVETNKEISNPQTEQTKSISKSSESSDALEITDPEKYIPNNPQCIGTARCIYGSVTRIIDGDTIVVGDKSIRFALVNTPEFGDSDYYPSRNYIEKICPVGSTVLVDEDDGQTQGSFGRIIAKIYCNNLVLNEEILKSGHAVILTQFCKVSEFAKEAWAKKFGC